MNKAESVKNLNEVEAAAYCSVSVGTMRRRRNLLMLPRYIKVGKLVRYSVEDLDSWLKGCEVAPKIEE